MTQFPHRKIVAATALAALLTVFALPAAAAPVGAWNLSLEMPTFLSWLDAVWTGLVGVEVEVDGPQSVYDYVGADAEPDGRMSVSSLTEARDLSDRRSLDGAQ